MDERELFSRLQKECLLIRDMRDYIPDFDVNHVWHDESRYVHYRNLWRKEWYRERVYKDVCMHCVKRADCKLVSYTRRGYKNVIINDFGVEREVIYCKQRLYCIEEMVNVDVDHSRTYIDVGDCLFPKDENMANEKFLENMANSARQSKDAFWGYALSNKWDYFITLTTDPDKVDRFDDAAVNRLWRICRQRIQRYDKNAKILMVRERNKRENEEGKRALHFHGFVAMRPFTLSYAIDPHTKKQMYSATGAPLFTFPFWDFGLATTAIIYSGDGKAFKGEELPPERDDKGNTQTTSQRRIVAYLSKYMGKEYGDVGYGEKRFFRTSNVVGKTKTVANYNRLQLEQLENDPTMYKYKEDDKRIIYRTRIDGLDNGEGDFCGE